MTLIWDDVKNELQQRVDYFEAVWSYIWHAQGGVLVLSLVEPLDRDLQLTDAGDKLAVALLELEREHPELEFLHVHGEPGRVPLDDVGGYRAGIDGMLESALAEITRIHRELADSLDVRELVALASVTTLIGDARRLIGQPLQ
jgi:hypothetical protein